MPTVTSRPSSTTLHLKNIPATSQATGAFDRGKITERKPIAMPHELAPQRSLGPLFYWAWAESREKGEIAMHPHQGFEILSYVLEGEMLHRDTLGTESRVTAGGVQLQQAGSGLSHEEVTGPARSAFFQIWFQPDLAAALRRPPEYHEFAHDAFPVTEKEGATIKTLLGQDSPIALVTDAQMHDVEIAPGASYTRHLASGRALASVSITGTGQWIETEQGLLEPVEAMDCTTLSASGDTSVELKNFGDSSLRVVLIEIPLDPGYQLYR